MGLTKATGTDAPAPPGTRGADEAVDEAAEPAETNGDRPLLGEDPGPISAWDTFAAAGRKAMWVHVDRLLRLEGSLADPSRTDDLKRYRVATRRLRAAFRLFGSAVPDRRRRALRDALGELGRAAGAVRDLDVRIAALDRWAAEQPDAAGAAPELVAPLRHAWQVDRGRASEALLARLQTRRHQRLLHDLARFVGEHDRATPRRQRSVRDAAASRILRAFEDLRDAAGAAEPTDAAALHQVRIDAKRLRYSLELLADVLPESRAELIGELVAIQDHLGAMNDAAVTAAAVRNVLRDPRVPITAAESEAIERYAADLEREVERLARDVDRWRRPIASAAFARRLARTVVIA